MVNRSSVVQHKLHPKKLKAIFTDIKIIQGQKPLTINLRMTTHVICFCFLVWTCLENRGSLQKLGFLGRNYKFRNFCIIEKFEGHFRIKWPKLQALNRVFLVILTHSIFVPYIKETHGRIDHTSGRKSHTFIQGGDTFWAIQRVASAIFDSDIFRVR